MLINIDTTNLKGESSLGKASINRFTRSYIITAHTRTFWGEYLSGERCERPFGHVFPSICDQSFQSMHTYLVSFLTTNLPDFFTVNDSLFDLLLLESRSYSILALVLGSIVHRSNEHICFRLLPLTYPIFPV